MHRQLGLGGSPSQLRNTSIGPIRCFFRKDIFGNSVCSPTIPQGGPFRDGWYPIYFAEPVFDPTGNRAPNAPVILFDLTSNPIRNGTISKAIISNLSSATPRLVLQVANLQIGNQFGLQVYNPVYQDRPCPATGDSNRTCSQLAGLVSAVFGISDLVHKSQRGLVVVDAAIRGDEFLLDLGQTVSPDGFVGARLFLPGSDCGQHANYSLAFGVDELYSSLNASANAPAVRDRLARILPAVCSVAQSGALAASIQAQIAAFNASRGLSDVTLTGFSAHGAFYVKSFLVADRRWAYLIHTESFAYRATLSTNSPPIVLAAGIVLAAVLLGGSLVFRKLQLQIRHGAFVLAFRAAKAGDKATPQHLPPKLQADYVAEEVLGCGTYARVVRARRRLGGETVAIKVVLADDGRFSAAGARQLRREALALSALTADGCEAAVLLAGVGAVQIGPGAAWFVLELLAGPNLESVVHDPAQGPLGEADCMDAARRVLAVLRRLHGGGVLHRDVKPANIVRCGRADADGGERRRQVYKLVDFGSVLGVDPSRAEPEMLRDAADPPAPAGTRAYMSPEMLVDPAAASYGSDLWSLGVTMFELVTARLPFHAGDDEGWAAAVAGDMDAPAPNVLDSLEAGARARSDIPISLSRFLLRPPLPPSLPPSPPHPTHPLPPHSLLSSLLFSLSLSYLLSFHAPPPSHPQSLFLNSLTLPAFFVSPCPYPSCYFCSTSAPRRSRFRL